MPRIGIPRFKILRSNLGDLLSFTELGPPEIIIPDKVVSFKIFLFILLNGITSQNV